jgi:hypothetical protein
MHQEQIFSTISKYFLKDAAILGQPYFLIEKNFVYIYVETVDEKMAKGLCRYHRIVTNEYLSMAFWESSNAITIGYRDNQPALGVKERFRHHLTGLLNQI